MATAIGSYATATAVKQLAGFADTDDDTLLGLICDRVNAWIESPFGAGRPICPISSATYLLDGDGSDEIYFRLGVRSITSLSVGDYTGDTKDAVHANDRFLEPKTHERPNGWPAEFIVLSDRPASSSVLRRTFPVGKENIELICTAGWAAISDDVTEAALTTAVRAWGSRQNGQADIVGDDSNGEPLISRFVSGFHKGVIRAYRPLVVSGT